MPKQKKQSNAFSTGGGGPHFEKHVQALYVTLMLTGGCAPFLPTWPITKIQFQAKKLGIETDDIVVTVQNLDSKEERKLICQIRHKSSITQSNKKFGEVMLAAWGDYNNSKLFTKNKDAIALITGDMSTTDAHNIQWILEHARHTSDAKEFFTDIKKTNFSPYKCENKLAAIRHHLAQANHGKNLTDEEFYNFLKHFYVVGCDLGKEYGIVLSLIHSHISPRSQYPPEHAWCQIVDTARAYNQDAGTITLESLPEKLSELFHERMILIPPSLFQGENSTDWANHEDAYLLSLAILLGSWSEENNDDWLIIQQFTEITRPDWKNKTRKLLNSNNSPFEVSSGTWKINNRIELIKQVGRNIQESDLKKFTELASQVLRHTESPSPYSKALKKGVAEGLALIQNHFSSLPHCSIYQRDTSCICTARSILSSNKPEIWQELDDILPILAEASPNEFLERIESLIDDNTLNVIYARSYGSQNKYFSWGVLKALEVLAWTDELLPRVSSILGNLAKHEPDDKGNNRALNILQTILLPWSPQTLAKVSTRKDVVAMLFRENREVAQKLTIELLPYKRHCSFDARRPQWANRDKLDYKRTIKNGEFWDISLNYSMQLLKDAGHDPQLLNPIIENIKYLPLDTFNQLICILNSAELNSLPDEEKATLWVELKGILDEHREFPNSKYSMHKNNLLCIESILENLLPQNRKLLYKYLFTYNIRHNPFYQGDTIDDCIEKRDQLHREAIEDIYHEGGINAVIQLSQTVDEPKFVGRALAWIEDNTIEEDLFPKYLNKEYSSFISGFVLNRFYIKQWPWCEGLEKSEWTPAHIGFFLAALPSTKEIWDKIPLWLGESEKEYWIRANVRSYNENSASEAIEKLIEYRQYKKAIRCLYDQLLSKVPIVAQQAIDVLAKIDFNKAEISEYEDIILELLKYLLTDKTINKEDLLDIEWKFIEHLYFMLDGTILYNHQKLCDDPVFFCKIVRMSQKGEDTNNLREEELVQIQIAWRMLYFCPTIPGMQVNDTFNEEHFRSWFNKVNSQFRNKPEFLKDALYYLGRMCYHAPQDPSGLWIHKAVAQVLDAKEHKEMRDCFSSRLLDSRGCRRVDHTGKDDRDIANGYKEKAKALRSASFSRLANTLDNLAMHYDSQADQHQQNTPHQRP